MLTSCAGIFTENVEILSPLKVLLDEKANVSPKLRQKFAYIFFYSNF